MDDVKCHCPVVDVDQILIDSSEEEDDIDQEVESLVDRIESYIDDCKGRSKDKSLAHETAKETLTPKRYSNVGEIISKLYRPKNDAVSKAKPKKAVNAKATGPRKTRSESKLAIALDIYKKCPDADRTRSNIIKLFVDGIEGMKPSVASTYFYMCKEKAG